MSTHSERVIARKAINGQPNGYRPITEQELRAEKIAQLKAYRDEYIGEGGRYWQQDPFTVFSVREIGEEIAKLAA